MQLWLCGQWPCDTTWTGMVPLCSLQLTWPSMSRLLARSLLTCPSAISARSFASSSSCWALRHRERLMFACSSCNQRALAQITLPWHHWHLWPCHSDITCAGLTGTALHCQCSMCLYLNIHSMTTQGKEQLPHSASGVKIGLCGSKGHQFQDYYTYTHSVVSHNKYSKAAALSNSAFNYFNNPGSPPFRNLHPGPTEKSSPLTASSACFLYAFTFNCSLSTRSWSRRIFFLSSSDCRKWKASQPWQMNWGDACRRVEDLQYLVSELLQPPFILAGSFQGFYSSFLLRLKLIF